MEILPKPSPTQALLRAVARRADGHVIPHANLRGGARGKAMTALMRREWIEASDGGFVLTDAGYAAIGQQRPAPQDEVQPVNTIDDLQVLEGIPIRPGIKPSRSMARCDSGDGCDGRPLLFTPPGTQTSPGDWTVTLRQAPASTPGCFAGRAAHAKRRCGPDARHRTRGAGSASAAMHTGPAG